MRHVAVPARALALVCAFVFGAAWHAAPASAALSNTPAETWMVNGPVRAIAQTGNILWIGGRFTELRSRPGAGATVIPVSNLAAVDATTGAPVQGLQIPRIEGGTAPIVYALEEEAGRLYIGGQFSTVNGQARPNLAAVTGATGGFISTFRPTIGVVQALAASTTKLYVGGNFLNAGKQPRMRLAAFNLSTGALDAAWRPSADARIRDMSMAPLDASVYVVGHFKNAAGTDDAMQPRNSVARFDPASGALDGWEMGCPCATELFGIGVQAAGDRVYVGMGGSDWVAALDTTSGEQIWHTDTYGELHDVAVIGNRLAIGGHFAWVAPAPGGRFVCTSGGNGCVARSKLAALDLNGVLDQSWDPRMTGPYQGVWRLEAVGERLWAGGEFTGASGVRQERIALFGEAVAPTPFTFADDFETGDMSRWTTVNGVTVQSAVGPLGPTQAARATAAGTPKYAYRTVTPTTPEIWYRVRFNVLSRRTAATLLAVRSSTGTELFRVFITPGGLLAVRNMVLGVTRTSAVPVAPLLWHELRLHVVTGAGGASELWFDGLPVPIGANESIGTAAVGRLQLGDTASSRTFDILFDDVDASATGP